MNGNYTGKKSWASKVILISGSKRFKYHDATTFERYQSFSSIDETRADLVDVSCPVLLAEISPGYYNLIDGNHRMEKARRMGISRILAYRLNVKQHIEFLTARDAYLSYVEYWNGKLK